MPPTTESIPDKPNFDVYGAMVILTCLLTVGAALIVRQDLIENWGFGIPLEDPDRNKVPVHITELNDDAAKHPSTVAITETDLKEWKLIRKRRGESEAYPVRNFEWPQGYKPLEFPVRENVDNLQLPAEQREALMRGWDPLSAGAAPAPEPPKTEGAAPPPETKTEGEATPPADAKVEEQKPDAAPPAPKE